IVGSGYYYGYYLLDSRPYYHGASVLVYDISSKSHPNLIQNVTAEGYYVDSRLIGDHVYLAVTHYLWYWYNDDEIHLPVITNNGVTRQIKPWDIYYWADPASSYTLTSIISINVEDSTLNQKIYLTDAGHEMYVSEDYVYLAKQHYVVSVSGSGSRWFPNTVIHKIAINEGRISYVASGIVPGRILNQFSMDEHKGYFRIATTTGGWWRDESKNNVYVMNKDMETVGKLEGLAPGETIYSARFFGNRCYLVTFKKIDPFFVIDLRNPESPKVLGKLKIPGFSTYLHPYDENHVIGIGKNADDQGDFAWFQGLKMSLFDVTNVYRPKEIAKIDIGDRGTQSEALYDHKAFLFDKSRDLLIIPIQLHEVDESKYSGEIPPNAYGEFVTQGAFVFKLTIEDGFELKGTISHMDENWENPYTYWRGPFVRRSLYIEDNIYTVSNGMVKINDMDTLAEIKTVDL
ncbi:MAG: beta-propeller domain-containing protein, partial [Thermoplasmata archaeon]